MNLSNSEDALSTDSIATLREKFEKLAQEHEESAKRDLVESREIRPSSAGSTGAVVGYIFSSITHEKAAKSIREILAQYEG